MRTDIHTAKNFLPEDYEYVGSFDSSWTQRASGYIFNQTTSRMEATGWYTNQRKALYQPLLNASQTSVYQAKGKKQCDHCGAHISYVAVFLHKPTGDHIGVGEICTENRFPLANEDFLKLRTEGKAARDIAKKLDKQAAFIQTHPEMLQILQGAIDHPESYVLQGLVHKFNQYGDLFEWNFQSGLKTLQAFSVPATAKVADPHVAIPADLTRAQGTITKVADVHGDFGLQTKMTLKVTTPQGSYFLYGTMPASLVKDGAEVGDTVRLFFTGAKQANDKDWFGFYNRPKAASIFTKVVK